MLSEVSLLKALKAKCATDGMSLELNLIQSGSVVRFWVAVVKKKKIETLSSFTFCHSALCGNIPLSSYTRFLQFCAKSQSPPKNDLPHLVDVSRRKETLTVQLVGFADPVMRAGWGGGGRGWFVGRGAETQ